MDGHYLYIISRVVKCIAQRVRRGRNRMSVGFTTTYVEIYSVSAEKIISDAFSNSENV